MNSNKRAKYLEIFEDIKNKINNGEYKGNDKLPSKRNMALNLNVSLNTIINAYNLLLDEGYIYSIEKKGYFVSNQPLVKCKRHKTMPAPIKPKGYPYDFTSKNVEGFPDSSFKKAIKEALGNASYLDKNELLGSYSLRYEIANHLSMNRGINASVDNIVIGTGIEMLEGILRLIDIDTIILENPGYHRLKDIARGLNKNISYQELDPNGVTIPKETGILYTTPFNQFPTGIKMTISRKKEIISYLNKTNSYLIEDDFDAEFRINQNPTTALYSIDNERVIFFSTFSTTMFPGLRIAYSILPDKLMKKYKEYYKGYSSPANSLAMESLACFIRDGSYASLVNKRKKLYLEKRRLCIEALKENSFSFNERANYLSLLVYTNKAIKEELINELRANGINIMPLSSYDILNRENNILVLGYTSIPKAKIRSGICLIKKIIGSN